MDFRDRLAIALRLLERKGLRKGTYAPPLHRLLWLLNVPIRPPHFSGFLYNLMFTGIYFGAFWGCAMWFLVWRHQSKPIIVTILLSAMAGVFFGLAMGAIYHYGRRKHALPDWSELRSESQVFD
jgi:hypothetical protein